MENRPDAACKTIGGFGSVADSLAQEHAAWPSWSCLVLSVRAVVISGKVHLPDQNQPTDSALFGNIPYPNHAMSFNAIYGVRLNTMIAILYCAMY